MSKLVREIERSMEAAFRPGYFINYRGSWDFVRGLERVADEVRKLIEDGQAADASSLIETFIAACYEKSGEIDDSSGSFGMFVGELFCDWVRARQATDAKPEETVETLLVWMENDDYGFCHDLERDIIKVMNSMGLNFFADAVRIRLDTSLPDDRGFAGYPRRRWTLALKRILAARKDTTAYLALCKETVLESRDCTILAEINEGRGRLEEALVWVERGLSLAGGERFSDGAEYDLKKLRRRLLPRLGRTEEAIAITWAELEERPGRYTYETLMELVPESDYGAWHERAMSVAEHGELSSVIGLFVETGEVERLAARIERATDHELEEMSHFTTGPAAKLLTRPHPAEAGRVFRALGLRIVNAGKSKYYSAAIENLQYARDCYLAAGSREEWDALVAEVRRNHGRKYRFIPGFERVVDGGPAREHEPSFLERARKRWPQEGRGDDVCPVPGGCKQGPIGPAGNLRTE